ncbi:MAG: hypothetical protein JJ920_05845 [Roseitalea sp.]|jgi:hypothetical protein|nr:hypothetical protein [Roseitalea sp.]MBO6722259.1 hypothetical protein [Roseitalea sp.]MBO6742412.1 hypothetical protein [Roseitalea sp.]
MTSRSWISAAAAAIAALMLAWPSDAQAQLWHDDVTIVNTCDPLKPPGDRPLCADKLIEVIERPTNMMIFVLFYAFNQHDIYNALLATQQQPADRRPQLFMVADQRRYEGDRAALLPGETVDDLTQEKVFYDNLVAAGATGIRLRGGGGYGNMHNKILATIRVETSGQQRFWIGEYVTGSFNFTNNANLYSYENMVFLQIKQPNTLRKLLATTLRVLGISEQAFMSTYIQQKSVPTFGQVCSASALQQSINAEHSVLDAMINLSKECSNTTLLSKGQSWDSAAGRVVE